VNVTPWPLYPLESHGTACIGGWVGPRVGPERCGKSRPHRDSIPGQSSPYRVAIPTELSRSSPLRPPHQKLFSFVALFPAAYTTCSFLQAASLHSTAGCMRFLFHTSNRTTGPCFLDLRQLQMELLFVALNFGTLTSYIVDLTLCFADSLPSTELENCSRNLIPHICLLAPLRIGRYSMWGGVRKQLWYVDCSPAVS